MTTQPQPPLKADVAAAERVLKAAVREAVALLRGRWVDDEPLPGYDVASFYVGPDRAAAEAVLIHAGYAAELLLVECAS